MGKEYLLIILFSAIYFVMLSALMIGVYLFFLHKGVRNFTLYMGEMIFLTLHFIAFFIFFYSLMDEFAGGVICCMCATLYLVPIGTWVLQLKGKDK